jgi:hypothetical protein
MNDILIWEEISIEISIRTDWPIKGTHHLELRAPAPLPVTSTGYRSVFITSDALARFSTPKDYDLAWLDEAATSKEWRRYKEESRQLSLF